MTGHRQQTKITPRLRTVDCGRTVVDNSGSRPCGNDALTRAVINGSNCSRTSFRRKVGIRSSVDDLEGDAVITRRTSASVTDPKTVIEVATQLTACPVAERPQSPHEFC